MPLYEYHCHQCGSFEITLEYNQIVESYTCPHCCQQARRLFSPPTFCRVFSGTRHVLHKRANQSFEPRIMNKEEKDRTFGSSGHAACGHGHHNHKQQIQSKQVPDRPWMMKH